MSVSMIRNYGQLNEFTVGYWGLWQPGKKCLSFESRDGGFG